MVSPAHRLENNFAVALDTARAAAAFPVGHVIVAE
jgi:hypothetical protein